MTLGERIAALRQSRRLSQDELAARVGVTRQSVSKWENDASVPDLDRLLQLSQLFGVTIDELVKGGTLPDSAAEPEPAEPPARGFPLKKAVGLMLLAVGLLTAVLALALPADSLLLFAGLLLPVGVLLLAVRRHTALWVGGLLLAVYFLLSPVLSGILPLSLLTPAFWQEFPTLRCLLVLLGWAALALWVWGLVRAIRQRGRSKASGRTE